MYQPRDLLPALDRGVAGVITTRMSRVGIVKALEMFLAGETYVPSQFLVGRGLGEPRAPYAAAPAPGAGLGAGPGAAPGSGTGAGRRLTARQRQVVALLAGGKTNKEIAARLGTTQANAADHVKRLMKKLDAANRAEAAAKAVRLGLSEPEPA
ncbi:MAG: helix-turn-helix transcriptional regulator [Kiloniellaceae bacterium]